jgi:hypothetical protein
MRGVFFVALCCIFAFASAHNSYTGGYSGAPGTTRTCASSCHGGSAGTLTVTGFPASYQPGQSYRIVIKHNGGSPIVNFNATTRIGSSTTVAGTFSPITNCTLYPSADGGVYASPHSIDSAVFQWTAPSLGSGPITLYAAAFQGTTSSSSGQSKALSIASSEIISDVSDELLTPTEFYLGQNYPNPFNPSTNFEFHLPARLPDGQAGQAGVPSFGLVTLNVYDLLGREVAALVNEVCPAGVYTLRWDASSLPSGIYFYRLRFSNTSSNSGRDFVETKRLVLMK